jgi:glucosamine-phosphate N-acetyltransferase
MVLPSDYIIRELKVDDFHNGYLNLLLQLSEVGDITKEEFINQYIKIKENNNHHIYVIEDSCDNIVGTCTLLVEPKFLHNTGNVGHIEDVVIDKDHRAYGLGSELLKHMISLAKSYNCYKVILDCKPENTGFYEKNGFFSYEISMRKDLKPYYF